MKIITEINRAKLFLILSKKLILILTKDDTITNSDKRFV